MKAIGYAGAILAVLLALYVGAYYALVERHRLLSWSSRIEIRYFDGDDGDVETNSVYAEYRFGGDSAKWLFKTAHRVDRKIRPDYWSEASYDRDALENARRQLLEMQRELVRARSAVRSASAAP